jgi:hypothetical protein
MKTIRRTHGKISEHFKGLGTVTSDTVVARAREIALINGRTPNQFNQDDFEEAKLELTGGLFDGGTEEEKDGTTELVAWDENPNESGHAARRARPEDEQSAAEQLVEEGMEEAEHEHMVEGARNPHNQE